MGHEEATRSPEMSGISFTRWATKSPAAIRGFVLGQVLAQRDSVVANCILESFETYLQTPPERKEACFKAYRAGSLAVLYVIDLSVPQPTETRGAVVDTDIWSKTKKTMIESFSPDICGYSEFSDKAFIAAATAAALRHSEFNHLRNAFEDTYGNDHGSFARKNVALGMGLVLHQWDAAWQTTLETIYRETVANFDWSTSQS